MSSSTTPTTTTTSRANESVIDAYATKVLKTKSPPEACIDDSLGPYLTSLLRCSLTPANEDVKELPEFDSLIELVEEHCALDSSGAINVLEVIAKAVRTGEVPMEEQQSPIGLFGTMLVSDLQTTTTTKPVLPSIDANPIDENFPSLSGNSDADIITAPKTSNAFPSGTPLKPDRLIPVDLLEDPQTPTPKKLDGNVDSPSVPSSDAFPPLGTEIFNPSNKSQVAKTTGAVKKTKQGDRTDSVASLYHHQTSADEAFEISPNQSTVGEAMAMPQQLNPTYESQFYQQQVDSTVAILLSMNPDLSENAASKAAVMASGDINVAQYIIDTALSAPPVCRHLLNDGCYRSDCHYSHDVEGHTCLFWMRGRCGKGEGGCRFYHGFSEKILDGINREAWSESKEDNLIGNNYMIPQPAPMLGPSVSQPMPIPMPSGALSQPMPIPTKNLVSHNFQLASSGPQQTDGFMFGSLTSQGSGGFGSGTFSFPGNHQGFTPSSVPSSHQSPPTGAPFAWETPSIDAKMSELSLGKANAPVSSGFSFASVAASKGGNNGMFVEKTKPNGSNNNSSKLKTIKIPQDVWSPHINRSAGAFHIADPIDRYNEVAKSVSRRDVIDLHFQSTKTFSKVLASVLPRKLREHSQVWIVTGSGHHVGRNTHQKGGGALETAVLQWLELEGYVHLRGRDRNGYGGCVLVKQ